MGEDGWSGVNRKRGLTQKWIFIEYAITVKSSVVVE